MPQVQTKQFGTIEYREEEALSFPAGLPAFEDEKRFLAVEREETKPLVFLQSLQQAELCFVTLPLLLVEPEYRLAVSAEDLRILGLTDFAARGEQPQIGRDVRALVIMSVTNSRPTANLLAPVVIRNSSRAAGGGPVAVQAIRMDSRYTHEQVWEGPRCS